MTEKTKKNKLASQLSQIPNYSFFLKVSAKMKSFCLLLCVRRKCCCWWQISCCLSRKTHLQRVKHTKGNKVLIFPK